MIKTVLRNIVSNAIKFTAAGGTITLHAHKNNEFAKISVADTGIGMSDKIINDLFRIDKTIKSVGTSGEQGSGLGILLCKEFVEKNGGKIWVESKLGEGSQFHFTLPLAE
jgi:signal transduction histidine kinase